jgi:crotonobetainyl-CoA hydratase
VPDHERSEAVVLEQRHDAVLVLTINRPAAMNAVDVAVASRLGAALETAEHDPDIRSVVLTGAGERAFCAGADTKAMARGERITAIGTEDWGFAGFVTHPISKPIVAAVNGVALGGGAELVLACDLAVASAGATFGLPEVTRGVIAGAGGLVRLPHQVPRKVAMKMILTGEPIDAATALQWGLINDVVEDGVVDAALSLAGAISALPAWAVQASKRVALGIVDGTVREEQEAWAHNGTEVEKIIRLWDRRRAGAEGSVR